MDTLIACAFGALILLAVLVAAVVEGYTRGREMRDSVEGEDHWRG